MPLITYHQRPRCGASRGNLLRDRSAITIIMTVPLITYHQRPRCGENKYDKMMKISGDEMTGDEMTGDEVTRG
ncbi:tyrosine-protein kinase PR2 [Biomphalaria glabrata]